ncbi:trafficking protein particle complex subunit 14-like [Heteronotia binoei]|uniref:trafficking protein particle complex subunit 14-like n=1 Tax=Heteronotia binoei TaxID=13085 RepID=UPI00292DDF8D|nr:trafficking protein particle complex subunit 14-like [Heteronotia binoei]
MESQCDYFPAVPFPAGEVLSAEPGRYQALPRLNHLYLGETLAGSLATLASISSAAAPPFTVTYTLLNNLQDFLAVRLVWMPESTAAGKTLSCAERRAVHDTQDSIICHTPLNNLGYSRKGSARTFCITFQALRAGLYELSQHMKLKLQFTASISNPPPEARPVSRKSSPGSPAVVRELVERHQASLGRSQSFSHQQPARGHLMRSRSVMERRAITPPVGSPVGRPLYLPRDKAALSLDKIAKRECKVLVVAPVT